METVKAIGFWLLMGIALAPTALGIGRGVVEHDILPRLIPREEIVRSA